jgi:branched-chain amino acid transport system substrate-binding protein
MEIPVLLDSKALTKIQSIILIAIIVVAAVGGGVAYVLLSGEEKTSDTIKIGVLTDLDATIGKNVFQGALLAAEQLNNKGGILGKQIEVIGEDTDHESSMDMSIISSAFIRLLTYHKVDFVVGPGFPELMDLIAEHKKIYIAYVAATDVVTQRVFDDYDKYKYFFKYYPANGTQLFVSTIDEFLFFREMTGFNKIGYIADDHAWTKEMTAGLDNVLPDYGFDLAYKVKVPPFDTFDFSSYFSAAEEAGVEILMPLIGYGSGIAFVKEYYDRQSPMVVFGGLLTAATQAKSWEQTGGKCKYITSLMLPVTAGYPLTTKTLPFRDSYMEMWNESPLNFGASAYDIIRFLLPDAIERAGTLETEAVIESLENTHIETSLTRSFRFTSNHDVFYKEGMLSDPDEDGFISALFQWQDEQTLVPIYPGQLMEEAGASYMFPDWAGPWDNLD